MSEEIIGVETYPLNPPVSMFLWGARAIYQTKNGLRRSREVWGRTRQEAEEKARQKVQTTS